MANSLGINTEASSINTQRQRPDIPTGKMSHQENLRRIVTGQPSQGNTNTLSKQQKEDILNQAFTKEKFHAVETVEKAREKLNNDIESQVKKIEGIQKELQDLGWEGRDAEMMNLAVNTLVNQVKTQVMSKLRTGKFATSLGIGEIMAAGNIFERGVEMASGIHIKATHDAIDKFWNTTKLNYIPVVGSIAEDMSHILGTAVNIISVGFGKESDDEKLDRLKYNLQQAQSGLNAIFRDVDKLDREADKFIKDERGRYLRQREKLENILNKTTPLTIQDEAYINLEKYRDFY